MIKVKFHTNIDKFKRACSVPYELLCVPHVGDIVELLSCSKLEVCSVTHKIGVDIDEPHLILVELYVPSHLSVNGSYPDSVVKEYFE
jgi:hypothetical protein